MEIKVIASDLDGTLLDQYGQYDKDRFERILTQLEQKGIHFVVATGNKIERVNLIFQELSPRLSYVAENGGYVQTSSKILRQSQITQDDALAFIDYFKESLVDYRVVLSTAHRSYVLDSVIFSKEHEMIEEEQWNAFLAHLEFVPNFEGVDFNHLTKINMLVEKDTNQVIERFNKNFKGNLRAVTSGYGAIDILPREVDKASGLELLLKQWQLSPHQVMAFGDGENDRELLAMTPHSYAMANAPESVKKVALHCAPHHTDDGVLQVIEEFLKDKGE